MSKKKKPRGPIDRKNSLKLDYMRRERTAQGTPVVRIQMRDGLLGLTLDAWMGFARQIVKYEGVRGISLDSGDQALTFPRDTEIPRKWSDPDASARLSARRNHRTSPELPSVAPVIVVTPEPIVDGSKTTMTVKEYEQYKALKSEAAEEGITLVP